MHTTKSGTNKVWTFNALQFLRDSRIDHTTEGQKATRNRVQVHCPFCTGSRNYHLGIHVVHAYANCWRCGPHSIPEVIRELLHVSWREAYAIMEEYEHVGGVRLYQPKRNKIVSKKLVTPTGLTFLRKTHGEYLRDVRKFKPLDLVKQWGVQSTGLIGKYKNRIYIPINLRTQPVSYQCRSVKKVEAVRYMTCEPDKEQVFHKHTLYGIDNVNSDTVVVCEGVTDVWRLGVGAVATFGITYDKMQAFQLARFTNIYILYDIEPQAQKQAEKLANDISMLNGKANVFIAQHGFGDKDPGDLTQEQADEFMFNVTTHRHNL